MMDNYSDIGIDFENCTAEQIGDKHGLTPTELNQLSEKSTSVFEEVDREYKAGNIGFMQLPHDTEALTDIQDCARTHKGRWENLVVFGIGGSALGVTMLFKTLCHPFHNELVASKRNNIPRLYVLDNLMQSISMLRERKVSY